MGGGGGLQNSEIYYRLQSPQRYLKNLNETSPFNTNTVTPLNIVV